MVALLSGCQGVGARTAKNAWDAATYCDTARQRASRVNAEIPIANFGGVTTTYLYSELNALSDFIRIGC